MLDWHCDGFQTSENRVVKSDHLKVAETCFENVVVSEDKVDRKTTETTAAVYVVVESL